MVALPTDTSLLYPTLQAVQTLGRSSRKDAIYQEVIRSAPITPEQMAIEFPPTSTRRGSKVINRIDFALTYLKQLEALENEKTGVWSITEKGDRFLREGRDALIAAHKIRKQNGSAGPAVAVPAQAEPHPSDSTAQRAVEEPVRRALADEFGPLRPGTKSLSASASADFDAISGDGSTIVEIFAHVGPLKGGQIKKVASDAFKISCFLSAGLARVGVLAFIDADAARAATNTTSWLGEAIRSAGIEVRIVNVDSSLTEAVVAAQGRQRMVNG